MHTGLNPPWGANLEACATPGNWALECLKHRVVSKARTRDADSSLEWWVSDLAFRVRVRPTEGFLARTGGYRGKKQGEGDGGWTASTMKVVATFIKYANDAVIKPAAFSGQRSSRAVALS